MNAVERSTSIANAQDMTEESSLYHANKKPVLILCGDTLEFALSPDNYSAMVFRQFIEQVLPEDGELFNEIIPE